MAAVLFIRRTETKIKEKAVSRFIVPTSTSRIIEHKCEGKEKLSKKSAYNVKINYLVQFVFFRFSASGFFRKCFHENVYLEC